MESSDNCYRVVCIQNGFIKDLADAIKCYAVKYVENTKVGEARMLRTGLETSQVGEII